jgi:hypothetical protein
MTQVLGHRFNQNNLLNSYFFCENHGIFPHSPDRAMSSGYRNHYKNRLNWFSGAIAIKKNKQKMTIRAPSIPLDERKLYFYRDSIA